MIQKSYQASVQFARTGSPGERFSESNGVVIIDRHVGVATLGRVGKLLRFPGIPHLNLISTYLNSLDGKRQ